MIMLKGKYSEAKVFTNNIDNAAISQIIELLNQPFAKDSKIRIMPDVHAGKGCVIGFTANLGDIIPINLVGVDIGCGVLTVELGDIKIDLEKLDQVIREKVPAGFNSHNEAVASFDRLKELYIYDKLKDKVRIKNSVGSLGGGNHFIEVGVDKNDKKYLVVHTGSRNLGHQVARYYHELAKKACSFDEDQYNKDRDIIIRDYQKSGRQKEIEGALKRLKKKYDNLKPKYPEELCFLVGEDRLQYLHDMNLCQEYADLNRETIANIILGEMFDKSTESFKHFHTVHNYINFEDNIIRKGAISAKNKEKVLIPINMREGSILARGKGSEDWNFSAPHGAGRIMSRGEAKDNIKLEEFKESMKGIYTSSVNEGTIDEAPMAYKPIREIIDNIGDTVEVLDIIKPIYNFKA